MKIKGSIVKLMKLADSLDSKGFFKEANDIDEMLKDIEDKIEKEDQLEREEEKQTEEEIAYEKHLSMLVPAIWRVLTIPRRKLIFETMNLEERKAASPSIAQEVMNQLNEEEKKVLSYDDVVDGVRYTLCVLDLKDTEELEEMEERRLTGTEEDWEELT